MLLENLLCKGFSIIKIPLLRKLIL